MALEPKAAVRVVDANMDRDFEFKVDFEPAPNLEDKEALEALEKKKAD